MGEEALEEEEEEDRITLTDFNSGRSFRCSRFTCPFFHTEKFMHSYRDFTTLCQGLIP